MTTNQRTAVASSNQHCDSRGPANENQCGCCGDTNPTQSKFCAGCGHALFEPCVGCNEPVRLTQSFCNACGANLDDALADRKKKMMGWLKEAVDLAKNSDFDTALGLLQRVGKDQDYRLAEQIEKINQVVSRMTKLRDKNVAGSEALQQKAHEAAGENNHDRVIALLKKVPERLLSEQSATLLRQSEAMLDQAVALNAELKQAMASRDWCLMGGLANQLLALTPENANYQMIASKVGKKLIDGAKRCFQEHRFGRASELLDSVPDCQRDAGFESLRAEIDGIRWLTREIDQEPFASAGLGKMAVRLTKRCNNAENQKRVQQLTKQLKKAPAPSHALNPWNGSRDSWMGSEVGVFSFPQQIECPDALMKRVVKSDQPVAVALGLALQGLGSGRVSEDFLPPKKGILKSLARRKAKSAWGIDLGATALRAVLVSSTDDGFRLEDFVFIPFANPTCRTTTSNDTDTTSEALIVESLTRFYNENQDAISDTPVWANLPGHDVVSRSVQLPPLKDKLATEALQQETKQLLPIDIAELAIVTWLAPSHANPSRGRPALITAARKTALDSRASLFQQAGITLAGMQSSPVAAANFADHEFSDFLDTSSDDDESNVITLVDCGAVSSSLVMLSANALAIWTFENGGEELTKTVAKVTKTVLSDAEKLKCNPAAIEDPAAVFGCVEERLLSLKTRLQRAFDSSFQITATSKTAQVWCVGRGSRCHSWIRHVLIK